MYSSMSLDKLQQWKVAMSKSPSHNFDTLVFFYLITSDYHRHSQETLELISVTSNNVNKVTYFSEAVNLGLIVSIV